MKKLIAIEALAVLVFELGMWGLANTPSNNISWTPSQYFIMWNSAIGLVGGGFLCAFGFFEFKFGAQ
jgi:hypothetical protein